MLWSQLLWCELPATSEGFVMDGEQVRKTPRYLEKTVKGMVETNDPR